MLKLSLNHLDCLFEKPLFCTNQIIHKKKQENNILKRRLTIMAYFNVKFENQYTVIMSVLFLIYPLQKYAQLGNRLCKKQYPDH